MLKLFIYCFREFDEKPYFDALQAERDFVYDACPDYPGMDTAELARGYDAVCTTVNILDEALLEKFRSLGVRYILSRTIGYDHIDLKAAGRLGFKVSRVTYEPDTVADYAIMMLLMGLRKMRPILERAAVQDYSLRGKMGRDIGDCTVGVIGAGAIGKTVIRHLQGFGCRVLAYGTHEPPRKTELCEFVDLDTLYGQSDAITLHIPASAENYHMLGKTAFAKMKPGCLIVNTARGSVIDTDALIEALESGQLGGAALDVIEDEQGICYVNRVGECLPNRQMAQLRALPNVILTPHMAFYTDKVVRSMAEHAVQCMFDMEAGVDNPLILTL